MLILDGSEDHLVNIQGLPNCKLLSERINDDSDDDRPPPDAEPGFNLSNVDALEVEENEDGEDPTNFGQFNKM